MHSEFKRWMQHKKDRHIVTHTHTYREREREGEDQQGYSSNGKTLVADAKAEDASCCHPLMTACTPVHAAESVAAVVLKLQLW